MPPRLPGSTRGSCRTPGASSSSGGRRASDRPRTRWALASVLHDDRAAARHLTDAVATNDRIGAAAFAAVARHELANVLERRGDHARATALRAEATAAGRELEMTVPHDILRRF